MKIYRDKITDSKNTLDKATLGKFTQGNFIQGKSIHKYNLGLKSYITYDEWVDLPVD